MTLNDLKKELTDTGIKTAYSHFVGEQEPPYCVITSASNNDFYADNSHHKEIITCDVELYTAVKDTTQEAKIKTVFKSLPLTYSHETEQYISSEKTYMNRWSIEFIGD